jgi:hypothetical protein
MNLLVDESTGKQKSWLIKWQVEETVSLWNDLFEENSQLMEQQIDTKKSRWNNHSIKQPIGETTSRWNCELMKKPLEETTSWRYSQWKKQVID